MSGNPKLCTIDVFFGSHARGNQHHLDYRATPAWGELAAGAEQIPNLIRLSGAAGTFQAQFFNLGKPVQRCGSGNLAIATYIHHLLPDEANAQQLVTAAGTVQLGAADDSAYYLDKPLPQRPLDHPGLWQRLVGQSIVNSCYCGGDSDYALLEVAQPLAQLRVDTSALCRLSRRALIVVYRPAAAATQLRYFAPQYGSTEDAATGSASVQVAAYLCRHYPEHYADREIEIEQCSSAGGSLYLVNQQRQVLVRGRTAIRSHETTAASFHQ